MYLAAVTGEVVERRAVRQVGVPDEAEAFQQVKGAIHRGDVHSGDPVTDRFMDLFGRRVTEGGDGVEYELALRGDSEPIRA